MKKAKCKLKRVGALLIILLLCFNNFAAIVSDNDGSAFITKAEFESMKKDFEKQINTYNESIDSKIDGAIAAYLAGIRTSQKVKLNLDSINNWKFPVWINSGTNKWNDKTSNRYACSNPEIYTYQTHLWYDGALGDKSGWKKGMTKWDLSISVDYSTIAVSREGWTWHKNAIPGEKGVMTEVKKTEEKRSLGTESLTIYDRKQFGHGWKLIYWIADEPLIQSYSNGSNDKVGDYEYGAILGKETGNYNKYISTAREIRPDQIGATMVAGYGSRHSDSNYKTTLPSGKNRTTKYLTDNNVRSWANSGGGQQTYLDITEKCISAQAKWQDYTRDWCFTDDANIPAETAGEFCYKPYLPNNTTVYRYLSIQDVGWNYIHGHATSAAVTVGSFTAYSPIVVPYFKADRNSGWATNDYFSYLPAKQVRYKTSDGDVHYMDEGFYMLKLDQGGSLKFDIRFNASDGTANYTTNVAFAKAPFNKQFNEKDLLGAKVGTDSAKTENQIRTGSKVSIEIPDLKKDTPIYMKWTNAGTTDETQICVNSLDNIYLITN